MGQLHRLLPLDVVPPNGFPVPTRCLNRPLCFNDLSKSLFNDDRTNKFGLLLSPTRVSHVCKMSSSDMMSQLEIGRPEERGRQGKRVKGIFWILLLNIGVYMADHWFHVLVYLCIHVVALVKSEQEV
ncbi:hypothetical protein Scep_007540 [Stephania cephalantha]|uniref:Uncharacterized protein n=1 Tax=Stephania cephalantha TaxID=152367 RepID=A0AAP0KA18_9MAGN